MSTKIEWSEETWNPVTGCTKISRGCDFCYAERFSERFRGVPGHPFQDGFDLQLRPERLFRPFSWKKPKKIFVNSMSDLFLKDIPNNFVDQVFDVMENADWHIYQILTKRSSLMRDYLQARYQKANAPKNIWCGVSVEDSSGRSRIEHLKSAPAAVRFLSAEPLLGPLGKVELSGIHWVIVGGESGPKARPVHVEWVRELRDQCVESKVPFFFKQWGGLRPKSKGRELDGVEWNDYPQVL